VADTLVLCYHALSTDWGAALSVPPVRLERQLTLLVERGYRGATFTQALTIPSRGKTLVVTFDDGFRSVLDLAAPILAKLDLPGTVFLPTAFMDGSPRLVWPGIDRWLDGPHEHELAPLSWEGARSLARRGWEVGSHTRTHPDLTKLDDMTLAHELAHSRREVEHHLDGQCTSLAFPYGSRDSRVMRAAADAGYLCGAGLPRRLHRRRSLDWPRVGVYNNDSPGRFEAKVSRLGRHLIGVPAGEVVLRRRLRLRRRPNRY
jgi:peptidoglycan/xylan/chitin deacetylase (PgdA/CDA1 family)